MHIVLDDTVTAGKVVLDLQNRVADYDWFGVGLKATPQIRIGFHAGVVSKINDPIIGVFNYIGRNTSMAAKIEPIAFEEQVFVKLAFHRASGTSRQPQHDL